MIGMNAMAKYIVYTTWYHEKGLRHAEEMQDGMRKNVKQLSTAEDGVWWKMEDKHSQSITNYYSEDEEKKHRLELDEYRKNRSGEYSIKIVAETKSPVIDHM